MYRKIDKTVKMHMKQPLKCTYLVKNVAFVLFCYCLRSFKRLLIVSSNDVSLFPVNYTLQIELGPGVNKKHIVAVNSLSSSSVQAQQL